MQTQPAAAREALTGFYCLPGLQGTGATGWGAECGCGRRWFAGDTRTLLLELRLCLALNPGNLASLYGNEEVSCGLLLAVRAGAMHDRRIQARRSCLHHQAGRRRALLPLCRRWFALLRGARRPSCTFGVSRPQATRSNRQGTRARLKPLVRMWHEWRAHDEPAGVITRCRCARQTDRRQAPDRHRVLGPLR